MHMYMDGEKMLNMLANMDTSNSTAFCIPTGSSGGMIMYMEGFRMSLKGNQPCLNLYFPGWTLNTPAKFFTAMMGVMLMGILVECIAKLRHRVVRMAKRAHQGLPTEATHYHPQFLRWSITLMHGTQAFFGYILMLATMTFSVELLFSVVFGLALGYAIFFQTEDAFLEEMRHVTTNPCCAFMEEEAKEVRSSSFLNEDDDANEVITAGCDETSARLVESTPNQV